jgi:hypothetical protein
MMTKQQRHLLVTIGAATRNLHSLYDRVRQSCDKHADYVIRSLNDASEELSLINMAIQEFAETVHQVDPETVLTEAIKLTEKKRKRKAKQP